MEDSFLPSSPPPPSILGCTSTDILGTLKSLLGPTPPRARERWPSKRKPMYSPKFRNGGFRASSEQGIKHWTEDPEFTVDIARSVVIYCSLRERSPVENPVWLPHPSRKEQPVATQGVISDALLEMFLVGDISVEVGIIGLIYLDRLFAKVKGLCFDVLNWKKLVLACFVLASKVWDDATIWNEDFLLTIPSLTIQELGIMEHQLLKDLEWELWVDRKTYTTYFIYLATLQQRRPRPLTLKFGSGIPKRLKMKFRTVRRTNSKIRNRSQSF